MPFAIVNTDRVTRNERQGVLSWINQRSKAGAMNAAKGTGHRGDNKTKNTVAAAKYDNDFQGIRLFMCIDFSENTFNAAD